MPARGGSTLLADWPWYMSTLFGSPAGRSESTYLPGELPAVRKWAARAAVLAVSAVIVVGVSGCESAGSPGGADGVGIDLAPEPGGAGNAAVAVLPDLVGRGLQNAQDAAQDAGFFALTSHDALGRGRSQLLDRDWKVCFQDPAPGMVRTSTTVDLGAVGLDESCPATDQAESLPGPAGATMPDLIGKSAAVAMESLGDNASISFKDATGADRTVLVPSNWQICAQDPEPGTPYDGIPVTLTVAKFAESC
jgi:hypothetical protein